MSQNSGLQINDFRHEIKVPLQRLQYVDFSEWLMQSGLVLQKTFADRRIHSVYLDTAFLDDYQDNVSGMSKRGKIRFRWYNDERSKIVLELKNKRGRLANKLVIPLDNPTEAYPFDRTVSNGLLGCHRRSRALTREHCLFPCLHVQYERAYYEIAPNIRMTLDTDIHYQKLFPIQTHSMRRSNVDVVAEFKYAIEDAKRAAQLLSGMPGRVFRHSKYVVGVDTVCDL